MVNKPTYRDPAGENAYPNPIVFDMNGTNPPIYWEFDPDSPDDTYYIYVENAQGLQLWSAENFFPGGGGGGGDTMTYLPLTNYINNNQFIDNTGTSSTPIANGNLLLAPSNHQGFTPASLNPVIGTYGAVGPDIRLVTNTGIAVPPTDTISFPTFALNNSPMFPSDVSPVNYIRYTCTGAATGEAYKSIQFPITQKVYNLSNQLMTFSFWGAVTASPVNVQVYTRQYYGSSPSATPEGITTRVAQGSPITLTTTWTQHFINFTMPTVSGNSLGTPGATTDDDAVYMQLDLPLNAVCDVLIAKHKLYIGTLTNTSEFQDYDNINSINSTPRCGDIKTSLTSSAPPGWVAMNDGSIGNVGSGATTRANQDTFQLYKTIWDAVSNPSSNAYAPVSGSLGASAVADFLANKTLTLPLSLGRAMAGAGNGAGLTPRPLGSNAGGETTALTNINQVPAHVHTYVLTTDTGGAGLGAVSSSNAIVNTVTNTGVQGSTPSSPFSILGPMSFMNIFIKL
jgi:hypothetical protein